MRTICHPDAQQYGSSDKRYVTMPQCSYISGEKGNCRKRAIDGQRFCSRHTCEKPGCNNSKSTKETFCQLHTREPHMPKRRLPPWALVAVLLFGAVAGANACVDGTDCSLNGVCDEDAARCRCDAAWTGAACDRLVILPTDRYWPAAAYGGDAQAENISSWGGGVVRDDDGLYHMWVSEFVDGCGLAAWKNNSRIAHATAKYPTGPFARHDVALGVFSHNVVPLRAPPSFGDGSRPYYIFHLGTGSGGSVVRPTGPPTGGAPKSCGKPSPSAMDTLPPTTNAASDASNLAHRAPTPDGPWEPLPSMTPGCNNPAPVWHPNGTLFVACNQDQGVSGWPLHASHDGGLTWRLVAEIALPPSWHQGAEDPFLYFDARGNWHLLAHRYRYSDGPGTLAGDILVSGHGFSRDGLSWAMSANPPFDSVIRHTSGPATAYTSLERPKMLLDEATGNPTHLVLAASPAYSSPLCQGCVAPHRHAAPNGSCVLCKLTPGIDAVFTMVLPLQADPSPAPRPIAPRVIPRRPTLPWTWDRVPTSFQGSKKEREFNQAEVERLALYPMLTLEKWYTPCASHGPTQSGPSCDVENKTLALYSRTKAINPRQVTIFYWNTMLDFSFYATHARMEALEAAGLPSYLRDERGEILSLCNDGNFYCNITTFDWTKPHVRQLWIEQVMNMTRTGLVDGIFADHSSFIGINIGSTTDHQQANQLCNGKDAGRRCYNFTAAFKESFNSWHDWSVNYTQELLSNTTGGPVVQGPFAEAEFRAAGDACDFDAMRAFAEHGKPAPWGGLFVVQAPAAHGDAPDRRGHNSCKPDEVCMAAFLAAAKPYMYIYCQWDDGEDLLAETTFPEMHYHLGPPEGPAAEVAPNVWRRRFGGVSPGGAIDEANMTVVFWDNNEKVGNITWAGHPRPPPAPTPPPPATGCNATGFRRDIAFSDYSFKVVATRSAEACCQMCAEDSTQGCSFFSYVTATKRCFLKATGDRPFPRPGAISGGVH